MKSQDASQSQMRRRQRPAPRPASTARARVSVLRPRCGTADGFHFVGNFRWSGEGRVSSKNLLQRGELICSIKPKPECRENVFAHNTGLIRLNQNAHICICTQDYFNPTWFFKHTPNFTGVFTFASFFFFQTCNGAPLAYTNLKKFESCIVQMFLRTAVDFRV